MAGIIERVGPCRIGYRNPKFSSLARSIVYQQLSGKAARTIFERLVALCSQTTGVIGEDEQVVTPEAIRQLSVAEMRRAGLSQQKVAYIRDLADHATEGRLDFTRMHAMTDEEVIRALTAVKGVGVWTAHMFLMFALRRENVLPVGDLGIKNAIMRAYGKRKVLPKHIEKIAKGWHPYCSIASWYLWRSLDLKDDRVVRKTGSKTKPAGIFSDKIPAKISGKSGIRDRGKAAGKAPAKRSERNTAD